MIHFALMNKKEMGNDVEPFDLLDVFPRDIMETTPVIYLSDEPVWVGLKIEGILGTEARDAFAYYRLYTESEEHLDEELARKNEEKFKSIAGFTPTDVLEAMYKKEEEYGFNTRNLSPNLLSKGVSTQRV